MKVSVRRLLVALLIGVLLYGAAVAYSGFRQMRAALSDFSWWAFAVAIGLASANYVLRFGKWQYYLRLLGVRHVAPGHSALIFLSGFVLTITPGKLGEVFKSAVLQRTHGVPIEQTAPVVLAERLTDVIAIVFLVAVGSAGFRGGIYWALAGTACVTVALVIIMWEAPIRCLLQAFARRPRLATLVPKLERAQDSLRLVASPSALVLPVALSVVGWGLEGVALHVLLDGFEQAPALSFSVFFYATATLAGALVPVPGGLGVTEAVIHEQLVHVAHTPEPVAAASMILIRLATLWWAVLVGFVALGWLRLSFPRELSGAASPLPLEPGSGANRARAQGETSP